MHQTLFTDGQFRVLEALRTTSARRTFLKHSDYARLCREHRIGEGKGLSQEQLLLLFDQLGVIIDLPDVRWQNATGFLLNPRWLTYGVYRLINSKAVIEGKGLLNERQAYEILRAETVKDNLGNILDFEPDKSGFILEAMDHFKLCYRLAADQQTLVIPDRLPAEKPELRFDMDQALVFEFAFHGLLPPHVMPMLIVARHEEIEGEQVWRNGVCLRHGHFGATALAQVDHHARMLTLWVTGDQASRYFNELHGDIRRILERMKGLEYDEFVYLPEAGRLDRNKRQISMSNAKPKANFYDLLAWEAAGEAVFPCRYGTYNLAEVLKIMPKKDRDTYSQEIHIHNEGNVAIAGRDQEHFQLSHDKVVLVTQAREFRKRLVYDAPQKLDT